VEVQRSTALCIERQGLQAESRHPSNLALADATVHDRELELSAITSHSMWMPEAAARRRSRPISAIRSSRFGTRKLTLNVWLNGLDA
jgi:hypothetical protein